MNLAAAVGRGQRVLEDAGFPSETAQRDAVLLARHVLDWDAAAWLQRRHDPASGEFTHRFLALIERRTRHEPIAYILGVREFYGRNFLVTPAVLIPRPETEFVVEEALAALQAWPPRSRAAAQPLTIVDVGTGSGCLAVTLAAERPDLRVIATDISEPALDVARENARRLGVADRVEFRHGSFLAGVERADIVVSNPPYVSESDRPSLPREVADFEPAAALFAGADGLSAIETLVPLAARALRPGGWLVMEIGQGESDHVRQIIESTADLMFDHIRDDLQGIPRVAVARTAEALKTGN